jgi:hypothetical protein
VESEVACWGARQTTVRFQPMARIHKQTLIQIPTGFLGTLAGAFAGHKAEEALKDKRKSKDSYQQGYGSGSHHGSGKW